ncbi:TPA: hypothetical protein ACJIWU_003269 [Enterobacter chengduensis]
MSTITKQWLQQKISGMEAARDEIPFCLDEDDSNTLAALHIALASLEAEPVAWTWEIYGGGNMYAKIKPTSLDAIPLYTAPPASVSVPAAMEMDDDFDSAFEHGKAVGWNAYRAAMLQSFGNSEQLNFPVIQDGWKLVPIDPTKDMLRAGQSVVGFWLNTVHCYSKMLAAAPAAPQQEVAQALAKGMERYGDAMQELAKKEVK